MQAAGLEAWFEAYAEAYGAIRLAKAMAPFVWKRNAEMMRDACHFWWRYAKAVREASKGRPPPGVVSRLAFLGIASMLLQRWRARAEFSRLLPGRLVRAKYGQILRTALADWRAYLEDSTPRRKEGLRKLLAQAAELRLDGAVEEEATDACADTSDELGLHDDLEVELLAGPLLERAFQTLEGRRGELRGGLDLGRGSTGAIVRDALHGL